MTADRLEQSLTRAFAALETLQSDRTQRLSLIDSALILSMLPTNPTLVDLRKQLTKRLSQQLGIAWIRDGDLFEVFLLLTALWQHNPAYIKGDCLAAAIQRLIQCEQAPGGPYYSGDSIEIRANLQIAHFVRLVAKPLPNLDAFLHQAIVSKGYKDTELAHPYILYLLTSLYNHPELAKEVTKHRPRTLAHRVAALAASKDKEPAIRQALAVIYTEQKPTGWWTKESLLEGQAESQIATTAFVAGVLAKYRRNSAKTTMSDLQDRHKEVALAAEELFETRTEPLRSSALAAINKVCRANRGLEITLFSYFFARALKDPAHLTGRQHALLGAASVCGWIAYTVYDDFLDSNGTPAMLPTANVAMRASLDCFRATLPERTNFQHYVSDVFAGMDEANAWEVINCRFTIKGNEITIAQMPQYRKGAMLAARSFAHALGPMAVLAHHTHSNSAQTHCIESAFRHYLIARQIQDDLHDWHEDMQAGQASYVVTAILRDMHTTPGTYDITILLLTMQRCFMRTTMPRICELALYHIRSARKSFTKSQLLQPTNELYVSLSNLEQSVQDSLDQQAKALALLET